MKRLTLAAIAWYQRNLSGALPGGCRFQPTCSQYGYEAVDRHGLLRGGFITLWRLLRCHPFNPGGYDPPP